MPKQSSDPGCATPRGEASSSRRLGAVGMLVLALAFPAASAAGPRVTAASVRELLDREVPEQLAGRGAPGAVVAVVRSGEVLHLAGYGLADPASGQEVDPEVTPFAVGSLTKPMTAVAVLQLEESDRIRLDDDVSSYLDFPLRGGFGEPVTFEQLLTHTAGFETRTIARKARTARALRPLGEYLADRMPRRVRPPGLVSAYSNHGYALAGYLVERVAGIPYELYMRENVFKPLGMDRTSVGAAPLPGTSSPRGFTCGGDAARELPRDFIQTAPASMAVTTGADMARFMIALLNGGANRSGRVLERGSVRRMLEPEFSYDRRIPVRSLGLSAASRRAPRHVLHAGGVTGFHSALLLAPEEELGIFVAFNCGGSVWGTVNRFLDELDPQPERAEEARVAAAEASVDVGSWTGTYREAEGAYTTLEKLASLFDQHRIDASGPGEVKIAGERYLARGDGLFERADGKVWRAFRVLGGATYLVGPDAWERVPWWEAARFQAVWLLAMAALFISALAAWRRAGKGGGGTAASGLLGSAWRAAGAAAAVDLLFLAGLGGFLATSLGDGGALAYGVPWTLRALLVLPFVALVLTAATLALGGALFLRRAEGRAHHALVCLALLAFPFFLLCWNLLGFHF